MSQGFIYSCGFGSHVILVYEIILWQFYAAKHLPMIRSSSFLMLSWVKHMHEDDNLEASIAPVNGP